FCFRSVHLFLHCRFSETSVAPARIPAAMASAPNPGAAGGVGFLTVIITCAVAVSFPSLTSTSIVCVPDGRVHEKSS
ncbi:MAG: hypothetical protein QXW06_06385, partial [Thermoplasmata archaeon]